MPNDPYNELASRVSALERAHVGLAAAIHENTVVTTQVRENTQEIINAFTTYKTGMKIAGLLGALIKWAAGIVVAGVAVWGLYRGVK